MKQIWAAVTAARHGGDRISGYLVGVYMAGYAVLWIVGSVRGRHVINPEDVEAMVVGFLRHVTARWR